MTENRFFALAIDIGGTKMECGIVDSQGRLLSAVGKHQVPFNGEGIADPAVLIDLISPYVEQACRMEGDFLGIGLGCCGNINQKTGMAVLIANLHWRNVPFGSMVRDAFGLPVYAATDGRMALLGELAWGAGRGRKNVAWATIGTGYGGYLYLDGRLYAGAHGFAGNFGHNTWDELHGSLCGCGRHGCVETFVAGPAIARAGQIAADTKTSPFLSQIAIQRVIKTRDVFDGERSGDTACQNIIAEVIRLVSINLGGLVNVLDLEMIIIGGGVAKAAEDLVERISVKTREYLMTEEAKTDLIIVSETFSNSALFGASADVFLQQGRLVL
jgi:glucokinase